MNKVLKKGKNKEEGSTGIRSCTPCRILKKPEFSLEEFTNNLIYLSSKNFKKRKRVKQRLFETPYKEGLIQNNLKKILERNEAKEKTEKLDRAEMVFRVFSSRSACSVRSLISNRDKTNLKSDFKGQFRQAHLVYNNRNERIQLEANFKAHRNSITCLDIDQDTLYSASSDYLIKKWRLLKRNNRNSYEENRVSLCEDLDFSYKYHRSPVFVSTQHNGILAGYNDRTLKYFKQSETHSKKSELFFKCFCKLENKVLLASNEAVQELDLKTWKFSDSFPRKGSSCLLCLDESSVFLGDQSGKIKIFDRRDQRVVADWKGHNGSTTGISLTEQTVYSCSDDGSLKLWDLRTRQLMQGFKSRGQLRKVVSSSFGTVTGGDMLRLCGDNGFIEIGTWCKDFLCSDGCIIAGQGDQVALWKVQLIGDVNEYI